ncbi:two-component system sensor histidine kinase NtrB [Pseudoxanthomonas putridarboris]|uniref:histidine kinase n=1 Tax=Pseudoxanthomonas putridarboris TaxID=752605 RepID=A0ABU9J0Y9_9GAMM
MSKAVTTFDLDIEHLLLRNVTDYAIYMLDPQGFVLSWNAGGERIKGYFDTEIIGQHFSRFYAPEEIRRGDPERSLAIARSEGRYEAEGWRVRKDGSLFRASIVIDPIRQDGELLGFAKVTRDITEKYNAQQNLQRTERVLAQAQKVHAIGKLTLGVAHDFNNLLTVVMNCLDLLSATHKDDRSSQLIRAAMEAAERGSRLSRQMLAFSRAQELNPRLHDLNELVTRSMERYRQVAGAIVCCESDLKPDLPKIMVDADQLEAALMNLVSNARDAMSGGRIVISTGTCTPDSSLHPDADGRKEYVCVTVRDDGPGMTEEVRLRAMEPFFTTKDVGRGSGLGLSQVYGFAAQSDGFASIESTPGEGTAVTIAIPAAETPHA